MVECQVRKVSQRGGRRTWSRLLWKVRTKSWLFRLASGGPVMALLGSFDGVVKAKVWLNGFRLKGKRGNSKYRQPTNEAFSCKTMQRNEDAHQTHLNGCIWREVCREETGMTPGWKEHTKESESRSALAIRGSKQRVAKSSGISLTCCTEPPVSQPHPQTWG